MNTQRLGNQFVQTLLRSPLHGFASNNFMLVTVTGRKSGQAYTTPVNYLRNDDTLTVVSQRDRTWWRNLRGGANVVLRLQGRDVKGRGSVAEDDRGVAAGLAAYLRLVPNYAKYFGVSVDSNGLPSDEDIARAAKTRVVVQVKLVDSDRG